MSGAKNAQNLARAFEIICRSRYSERTFSNKPIADSMLKKILELTHLAPSSFNLQPYKLLVVKSDEARSVLGKCMLGGNSVRVTTAPVTVIFAADKSEKNAISPIRYVDLRILLALLTTIIKSHKCSPNLEPSRSVKKLVDLELKNGADPAYVNTIPAAVNFFFGEGQLSRRIKDIATHLLSPIKASPKISLNIDAWTSKNAAFAAQQFMLATTALGLCSSPMEGFDEIRVCSSFHIPMDDYTVPLVVTIGHGVANDTETAQSYAAEVDCDDNTEGELELDLSMFPRKPRFPLSDVCYEDQFGKQITF